MRTTPIHLLFPEGEVDSQRLVDIHGEATTSSVDPWNPLAVAALPSVASWVSEVRPGDQDPHAVHAYASLVFYSMHALGEHGRLFVVDEGIGRQLGSESEGEPAQWSGRPHTAAGYVQLPQNLFWVQTRVEVAEGGEEAGALAEPMDGIFWASTPGDDSARAGLWVMLAAGLRSGRPGFSAIALDRLPLADVRAWADADMRGDGTDFENLLPGGDLAGFLTLGTAGEALKLLARVWRHADVWGTTPENVDTPAQLPYSALNPSSDGRHA